MGLGVPRVTPKRKLAREEKRANSRRFCFFPLIAGPLAVTKILWSLLSIGFLHFLKPGLRPVGICRHFEFQIGPKKQVIWGGICGIQIRSLLEGRDAVTGVALLDVQL